MKSIRMKKSEIEDKERRLTLKNKEPYISVLVFLKNFSNFKDVEISLVYLFQLLNLQSVELIQYSIAFTHVVLGNGILDNMINLQVV